MSELGARIDGLSAEKRALLEQQLLKRRVKKAFSDNAIRRRDPSDPSPLSFAQQRLWFLDRWSPGSSTYNAALALRLVGAVDVDALRRALDEIVARQESLRTVFRERDGEPEQVVLAEGDSGFKVIDLVDAARPDERASDDAVDAVLRDESRRPFDLTADVMLRAVLVQVATRESVLLVCIHHIASDGWSRDVLFEELSALYRAFVAGEPSPLSELPIQYADYALWQRNWLSGENLERQVGYWTEALAGAPTVVTLPTDKPRPDVLGAVGAHHFFSLPDDLAAELSEVVRGSGSTLFMTLLAAFGVFLLGLSGQDDVLVGSPIANRHRPETEPLIGFFVNTLVFRIRMDGDPTFRELMERVRRTAVDAYAHQDLPFDKVVEALKPRRDTSRNPVFQVNFRVQGQPPPALDLPGLIATPIEIDLGLSRFDLAVEFQASSEGIGGYVEYNDDLFVSETAARWAVEIEALLRRIVANPDARLSDLRTAASIKGARGARRGR